MKKRWIIGVLSVFLIASAHAQNFEDVFNAFASQNQQSFNHFADSINRQFAEAMMTNMISFTGEKPKVRDPKPKPKTLPEIKNEDVREMPAIKPQQPVPAPESEPADKPSSSSDNLSDSLSEQYNMLEFKLFGENIRLYRNPFPEKLEGITTQDVSSFWIQLSECDYEPLLQACREARTERGFNDWAIYQLVLELARQTYPRQFNEQAVMAVFLLNQLGMEAKVGFGDTHLFCLVAVKQQLYGFPFADIAGNRYYIFEVDPKYRNEGKALSFSTYDIPFPEYTHDLDMNVVQPLKSADFPDIVDSAINISTSMIELFGTYPQVDIAVYANAHPSSVFCQSVTQVFQPYLKARTPLESVSFLLSYMQHGFDYATDEEQFGYEKPFFCEENYYYPKNDCEDRCVLFAFLVHHLLNLDVALVEYPGHVATAVHFPTEVKGKSVEYQGKRYVICDPTYVGASVGTEMPGFTPADRTVIPLKR